MCLKDILSTMLLFSDMSVHCLLILWWEELCGHPSPFCADSNSRFTIFIFDLLFDLFDFMFSLHFLCT